MTVLRPPGESRTRHGHVWPGAGGTGTQVRLTAREIRARDTTAQCLAEAAGAAVSLAWAVGASEKEPGLTPPSDLVPASPSR